LRIDRETGQPTYPSNPSALDEVFLAEFAPDPAATIEKGDVSSEEIRAVDLF
jgi:hypothetical protein